MDRCDVPRCRAAADLTYLGRGICERHWNIYASNMEQPNALRVVLGLPAAPTSTEDRTMDDGSKKTAKVEATAEAPSSKKGHASKPKKEAAPKEPKPVKEPASKPEPRTREEFNGEVVVFAFRLGSNDRDQIHAAAGPAGATRFVRSAALAAATGDAKAFEELVAQARANLK